MATPLTAEAQAPLQSAIEQAVDQSLQLRQIEARIQMKLAECWQAGLCPNPEIGIELSENRPPKEWSSSRNLQTSFGITQLLELGSKRSARQNVVAAEAAIVMWEWYTTRAELINKVTDAFIDGYAAQEKIRLLENALQNASQLHECHSEKVKQGKASLLQQKRYALSLSTLTNDLNKAKGSLESIKRQLNLLCGNPVFGDEISSLPLLHVDAPLPLSEYLCLVPNNYEISQLRAIQQVAFYNYELQKANGVPNMAVAAGVERYCPIGGCRFFIGIGMERAYF